MRIIFTRNESQKGREWRGSYNNYDDAVWLIYNTMAYITILCDCHKMMITHNAVWLDDHVPDGGVAMRVSTY